MKGITGASTHVEYSPRKRTQRAKRRRAQEKRWAARSGPVVIIKPADKKPDDTT